MSEIVLLGIDSRGITDGQRALVGECALLVGAERHLAAVTDCPAAKCAITPLATALTVIRERLATGESVAVLASGDPLFFGIGRRLLAEFGPERLTIVPGLSALQEACARFRIPWDDARLVSLHGRTPRHLPGLLLAAAKTVVFTDAQNRPEVIADQLRDYLGVIEDETMLAGCRLSVAENIGLADERLSSGTLKEIAARRFAPLNVLLVQRPGRPVLPRLGLTEAEISHSRGLITKDEVRAVALHRLALPDEGVLWDIGAGSGSVSVEAGRLCPDLTIFAVEKKQEELANIRDNIRRYGAYNVVPIPGEAPAVLDLLPDPDRVFVGGSGGELESIINQAAARLGAAGRIVANGVTARTVRLAPQHMAAAGLRVTVSRISCERNDLSASGESPRIFHPISIVTGIK
ncbi:MAG: precorrin-6y C5,15-methyltransferase (decarboxylating) subunit CbiE [Thermodesulfobacteriota bacterium]